MGRPKPEEALATWTLRLPVSFAAQVDKACAEDKMKRPDWLRAVLKEVLELRAQSEGGENGNIQEGDASSSGESFD
jgi:hypothetical protein